jgi:hypothetical protein
MVSEPFACGTMPHFGTRSGPAVRVRGRILSYVRCNDRNDPVQTRGTQGVRPTTATDERDPHT